MRVLAAFEWSFIWDNRGPLWDGFKHTMKAGMIGIVLAYVIGLVLGAVRAHRIPVLSQLAAVYVEVIRNTPILVQIFFIYYAPAGARHPTSRRSPSPGSRSRSGAARS